MFQQDLVIKNCLVMKIQLYIIIYSNLQNAIRNIREEIENIIISNIIKLINRPIIELKKNYKLKAPLAPKISSFIHHTVSKPNNNGEGDASSLGRKLTGEHQRRTSHRLLQKIWKGAECTNISQVKFLWWFILIINEFIIINIIIREQWWYNYRFIIDKPKWTEFMYYK